MAIREEVLAANKEYVETFGEKGELALPPARQFAISPAWTPGWIPPTMRASPRATPT